MNVALVAAEFETAIQLPLPTLYLTTCVNAVYCLDMVTVVALPVFAPEVENVLRLGPLIALVDVTSEPMFVLPDFV